MFKIGHNIIILCPKDWFHPERNCKVNYKRFAHIIDIKNDVALVVPWDSGHEEIWELKDIRLLSGKELKEHGEFHSR